MLCASCVSWFLTHPFSSALSGYREAHSTELIHAPGPLYQTNGHLLLPGTNDGELSAAKWVWSDHTLPVTAITSIGTQRDDVRVVTASLDGCCKVLLLTKGCGT